MGFFKSKKTAAAVDEEISELEKSSSSTTTTKPTPAKTEVVPPSTQDSTSTTSSVKSQDESEKKVAETNSTTTTITTDSQKEIPTTTVPLPTTDTTIPEKESAKTSRKDLPTDSFIHVQVNGEKFSDKASTLLPLVSHHVKCHVTYPIVQVVSTMTFNSPHSKTIEGELVLPMPDGATMMGYAMEINGKLVDAVPVEKEKAKAVFESEVRAGGTVSIVEKMTQASNCFKTKVYPMHPNQDKTIQVKYQMMLKEKVESKDQETGTLQGSVFIPVAYLDFDKLRSDTTKIEFTLNETSLQGYETELSMSLSKFGGEKIEKENQLLWTSKNVSKRSAYFQISKDQMKENMAGFNFSIKKESTSVNDILLAVENGYFMTSVPVPKIPEQLKNQSRIGDKIQLVWDCSLSQESTHAKKVSKLRNIIEGVGATFIELTQFSCSTIKTQSFNNVEDLLKYVESEEFVYDGGSNMLLFDKSLLSNSVDYCIAFTDGVHTFGHEIGPMCAFGKPIYFVNFSSIVNSSLLKHISTKSGGTYLNANELSDEELINSIGKPVLSFAVADFEDVDLKEVYPNEPVTLAEGEIFKLFGMFNKETTNASTKLAVSFRYGSNVFHVQELELPISEMTQTDAPIVPYLWAQKKIESLSAFPHLFKEEIKQLGFDFRIVTDSSSLVVLEKLDQYLKHDITPPETLPLVLEEFKKQKKQEADAKLKLEQEKIERILSMWKARVDWHKTDFYVPEVKPVEVPKPITVTPTSTISTSTISTSSIPTTIPTTIPTDIPTDIPITSTIQSVTTLQNYCEESDDCADLDLADEEEEDVRSRSINLPTEELNDSFSLPPPIPTTSCSESMLPPPPSIESLVDIPESYVRSPSPSRRSLIDIPESNIRSKKSKSKSREFSALASSLPPPRPSSGQSMPPPPSRLSALSSAPQMQQQQTFARSASPLSARGGLSRSVSRASSESLPSSSAIPEPEIRLPNDSSESISNSSSGNISIKAWSPDATYCQLIKSSSNPYKEYLTQRKSYRDSPAFYLDVADMFLTTLNSTELGVRVLSNVAELELENVQLYRIVGYRLDQAEELELAEWVFEKIKKISPHEPQSYRDLALVKERMGKLEESMQLFNKVITEKWDSRFDEIELTVATEMNHLLLKNPDLPIIDKRFIHNFDLDIRISMAWDTDMVDIDLHVKEPAPLGEHAYYAHNRTRIGGYVSRDFRQGYGPEEYMLKKAPKGVYKATTNYFSNHSQSLTGGTTILCTIQQNYMRPNEKRQMVTIRLSSHKQDIEIGEIEIV